jgi:hypothetical protein
MGYFSLGLGFHHVSLTVDQARLSELVCEKILSADGSGIKHGHISLDYLRYKFLPVCSKLETVIVSSE